MQTQLAKSEHARQVLAGLLIEEPATNARSSDPHNLVESADKVEEGKYSNIKC